MMQCLTYLHRSIAVLLAYSRGGGDDDDDDDDDVDVHILCSCLKAMNMSLQARHGSHIGLFGSTINPKNDHICIYIYIHICIYVYIYMCIYTYV